MDVYRIVKIHKSDAYHDIEHHLIGTLCESEDACFRVEDGSVRYYSGFFRFIDAVVPGYSNDRFRCFAMLGLEPVVFPLSPDSFDMD